MAAFAAKDAGMVSHKIQPHETLFRISLMYNSTVSDIEKANPGVDARRIHEGAVIKVPRNTKMRDPEFVASFLNSNHYNEAPVEQVASRITTTTEKSQPAERPRQVSMPVAKLNKPAVNEEKPTMTVKAAEPKAAIEQQPVAEKTETKPVASANFSGDENPFMTPSDPKPNVAVEGEQVKANEAAAKEETEDENPFVTPKGKTDDKDAGKTSSND